MIAFSGHSKRSNRSYNCYILGFKFSMPFITPNEKKGEICMKVFASGMLGLNEYPMRDLIEYRHHAVDNNTFVLKWLLS